MKTTNVAQDTIVMYNGTIFLHDFKITEKIPTKLTEVLQKHAKNEAFK